MDLANIAIDGVQIAALIFGIVEALKDYGIQGGKSKAAAFIISFLLAGLSLMISQGAISANVVPYIELAVSSLAYALAATGYYDFAKRRLLKE